MKKLRYIITWVGSLLLIVCQFSSCKKFVQIDPPKTQIELSRIFADDESAMSAATGIYYQMQAANLQFLSGGITYYAGLSSDELKSTVSTNTVHSAFQNNSLLSDDSQISNFWTNSYKNLFHINSVIEGLEHSKSLSATLKSQLEGEMLYMRALHYFLMVNLFGDIPLVLTPNYEINATLGRTPKAKVYEQIVADLTLSRDRLSAGPNNAVNTRPTKAAATSLLAKVFLYTEKWSDAEQMATEVIGSGRFSLEPLANVFLSTSKENIFYTPKQSTNTPEGGAFIPASITVIPTIVATSYLLDAFKSGDNRKSTWLKSNTVNGVPYYYPFKYKVRSSTTVTEGTVVQRLGELYLVRAEARTQQNKLKDAIDDVDVIRSRAGLTTMLLKNINPNISKEALLSEIADERLVELFAEWANRWMDLIRTRKADEILGARKAPNWESYKSLYPIPYSEMQKNPALVQNPGYKF